MAEYTYTVTLTKAGEKRTAEPTLEKQLRKIAATALSATRRGKGWSMTAEMDDAGMVKADDGRYTIDARFALTFSPKKDPGEEKADSEFMDGIVPKFATAGRSNGWSVSEVNEVPYEGDGTAGAGDSIDYSDVSVPAHWEEAFGHIYGRGDQIDLVLSAVQAAIDSDFTNRFHVCLFGAPACGKTEICQSLKKLLGDEAVLEYDATATTQAGAIKDLAERVVLPRILILEEAEKTDENSLRWLLSVLDHRGNIRKTTYRGTIERDARMLCISTVNDYDKFKGVMAGALASRFAHHVYCPRPDRKLLSLILEREIKRIGGDKRWIKPALDFAETEGITDPRKVTAIALCGRSALLSGEYQRKLRATSQPGKAPTIPAPSTNGQSSRAGQSAKR